MTDLIGKVRLRIVPSPKHPGREAFQFSSMTSRQQVIDALGIFNDEITVYDLVIGLLVETSSEDKMKLVSLLQRLSYPDEPMLDQLVTLSLTTILDLLEVPGEVMRKQEGMGYIQACEEVLGNYLPLETMKELSVECEKVRFIMSNGKTENILSTNIDLN